MPAAPPAQVFPRPVAMRSQQGAEVVACPWAERAAEERAAEESAGAVRETQEAGQSASATRAPPAAARASVEEVQRKVEVEVLAGMARRSETPDEPEPLEQARVIEERGGEADSTSGSRELGPRLLVGEVFCEEALLGRLGLLKRNLGKPGLPCLPGLPLTLSCLIQPLMTVS